MNFLDKITLNPPVPLKKGIAYPFIEMANVGSYQREPENVDTKVYSSGSRFADGDTIIARITPCLQNGKGFYCHNIGEGFGSTEFIVLRPKDQTVDSRYLYYLMQTNYIREKMIKSMVGASGRQRVNNDVFTSIDISFPKIEIQRRIADILSAYDDLIENNRKQIKLLEEAAQRLYKEWFVDLRFPGHEHAKIVDGVPEGWFATNINAVMTFHRGYDLTKNNMVPGKYPVVGSTSIIGYHNQYKISGPGIVTGRSGSLGEYQLIWGNFWPHNTSLYVSDMKGHHVLYLYGMLQTVDFSSLNNGGAIPTLNRNTLSNIAVLEAPKALQQEYVHIAEPYYQAMWREQQQILNLQEARDRLLPKLMSGEVEV